LNESQLHVGKDRISDLRVKQILSTKKRKTGYLTLKLKKN